MKVFVAGHRGMLGHVAARYLAENGCEVVTSEQRYQGMPRDPLIEEIRSSDCTWVVNALGKIKQKCEQPHELFQANTLFPLHLRRLLRPDQRLIHASTDCVFSGRTGSYSIDAPPDAEDEYGLSKLLGECVAEAGRAYVLRTSIIGPDPVTHAGLMGWFLRQRDPVNGFTNHMWNGVTTLEWSTVCLEIIQGRQSERTSMWQVGTWPAVSKYDLLKMIAETWSHPIDVRPHAASEAIDRSLKPTLLRPALPEQLVTMNAWYRKGLAA